MQSLKNDLTEFITNLKNITIDNSSESFEYKYTDDITLNYYKDFMMVVDKQNIYSGLILQRDDYKILALPFIQVKHMTDKNEINKILDEDDNCIPIVYQDSLIMNLYYNNSVKQWMVSTRSFYNIMYAKFLNNKKMVDILIEMNVLMKKDDKVLPTFKHKHNTNYIFLISSSDIFPWIVQSRSKAMLFYTSDRQAMKYKMPKQKIVEKKDNYSKLKGTIFHNVLDNTQKFSIKKHMNEYLGIMCISDNNQIIYQQPNEFGLLTNHFKFIQASCNELLTRESLYLNFEEFLKQLLSQTNGQEMVYKILLMALTYDNEYFKGLTHLLKDQPLQPNMTDQLIKDIKDKMNISEPQTNTINSDDVTKLQSPSI